MAEINITNLQAGQAAVDELVKGLTELNTVCSTVSSKPFGALESVNPDLGTNFNTELNNSLLEIYNFLNGKVAPALTEYFKPDDGADIGNAGYPYGGGGNLSGGGSSGGDGGSGGGNQNNPDNSETTTVNLVPPFDSGSLNEMKLDEIDGTVEALIALASDNNLNTYVESDVNADKIKQLLLDSPNIPQEFKDQIKDADSKVVRKFIEDMLKGKYPEVFGLNAVNLSIMHRYLEQIANNNGITVEQLINNPENSEILKQTLESFGNVSELFNTVVSDLIPEDLQTIMLKIYDGDGTSELPKEDTDVIRNFVDYLSEETDISYEELLTDQEYASELKEAAASFGKTSSFFKATSKFSDEGKRNNINNLYNGSNYKAYGMSMSDADELKKELDTAAKTNNTTTDKFLSDSQYADKVKEVIDSSKSCDGVGSIYKNEQSSVVQNVAKNIYNTKLEETVYDSKTKKYYYVTPSGKTEIPKESISNDGLTATITVKKSNASTTSTGESARQSSES